MFQKTMQYIGSVHGVLVGLITSLPRAQKGFSPSAPFSDK